MMTIQAKTLKQALKSAGITNKNGKAPTVRTEIFRKSENGVRYSEYGHAYTLVPLLNADQIATLKGINEYIKVQNLEMFSVVRY